jgi:hypothetical protein
MLRLPAVTVALGLFGIGACQTVPSDPIQLERNLLTVDNRTGDEWRGVEMWVNRYFRATAPALAAGSRLQFPLDAFVSGYGQRFDPERTVLRDVRLAATTTNGAAVTFHKEFQKGGLAQLGGHK